MAGIITVEQLNSYLQENVKPGDDARLDFKEGLITACQAAIENYTGLGMTQANYTETWDGDATKRFFLRNLPVNSIASITQSGSAIAATNYRFSAALGVITFRDTTVSGWQNYVVTYNAGYGVAPAYAAVPADIKLACKIWTATAYKKAVDKRYGISSESIGGENFTFFEKGVPDDVAALLNPYQIFIRSFTA